MGQSSLHALTNALNEEPNQKPRIAIRTPAPEPAADHRMPSRRALHAGGTGTADRPLHGHGLEHRQDHAGRRTGLHRTDHQLRPTGPERPAQQQRRRRRRDRLRPPAPARRPRLPELPRDRRGIGPAPPGPPRRGGHHRRRRAAGPAPGQQRGGTQRRRGRRRRHPGPHRPPHGDRGAGRHPARMGGHQHPADASRRRWISRFSSTTTPIWAPCRRSPGGRTPASAT